MITYLSCLILISTITVESKVVFQKLDKHGSEFMMTASIFSSIFVLPIEEKYEKLCDAQFVQDIRNNESMSYKQKLAAFDYQFSDYIGTDKKNLTSMIDDYFRWSEVLNSSLSDPVVRKSILAFFASYPYTLLLTDPSELATDKYNYVLNNNPCNGTEEQQAEVLSYLKYQFKWDVKYKNKVVNPLSWKYFSEFYNTVVEIIGMRNLTRLERMEKIESMFNDSLDSEEAALIINKVRADFLSIEAEIKEDLDLESMTEMGGQMFAGFANMTKRFGN